MNDEWGIKNFTMKHEGNEGLTTENTEMHGNEYGEYAIIKKSGKMAFITVLNSRRLTEKLLNEQK